MPLTKYLSDEDHDRVSAAVAAAERNTAGEIVTILADRSDGYSDVQLAWAALAAFLKLAGLALWPGLAMQVIARLSGDWNFAWSEQELLWLAAVSAAAAFLFVWLIQLLDPVRFALVPGIIKTDRVHDRAVRAFRIGAERRTHGRTGILIYLSMREHRAEIVADEAIATRVAPDVWGEAMVAMIAELKAGRIADGMIAGVERVGKVLAEHLPAEAGDSNELPDRLIEV